MFDFSRPLVDELVLGDTCYQLNVSFNRVMKIMELINDEQVEDWAKPYVALTILTDVDFSQALSPEEATFVFKQVFEEHILAENLESEPVLDLTGKPIKNRTKSRQKQSDKKRSFSLIHDAEYIYSAFLQAYQIDLFEVQDKLHWRKFNALLVSLPSNTTFSDIMKIRSWEPQDGDSRKYKERMKRLQREHKLPDDTSY